MVKRKKLLSIIIAAVILAALAVSGVAFASAILTSNASTAYATLPSWWSGDCDKDYIAGAKLIGTWNGLQVCEPGDTKVDEAYGTKGIPVRLFQCTDLIARYMYAAHGYSSVTADGGQVVDAYTSAHPDTLHRIYNDSRMGIMKIMPQVGDVISFSYDKNHPTRYDSVGHVSIVGSVDKVDNIKGSETINLVEQNYPTGTASIGRQITVTNWQIDDTVVDWMTTRNSPGYPGGWWTGPTPPDHTSKNPGDKVEVNFRANDNNNTGLDYGSLTIWTKSHGWQVLPSSPGASAPPTKRFNGETGTADVYAWFIMPNEPVLISADVWSRNKNFQFSPSGERGICTSPSTCPPSQIVYDTEPTGGYGGGDTTPSTTEPQLCSGTNYTGNCVTLPVGVYNDVRQQGINWPVLSVYVPSSQGSVTRTVFLSDQTNQGGTPQVVDAGSIPDMKASGRNTTVLSARIEAKSTVSPSSGQVQLCTDTQYRSCKTFGVGVYDDISQQGIYDPVRSVRVPSNRTLFASDQTYQKGTPQVFDTGNPDLAASGRNTTIKSIRVEAKQQPTPVPTQPPSLTPTASPTSTLITITDLLDGIGIAGDATHPSSAENMSPLHPNRNAAVLVYNGNSLMITKYITISYVSGMFNGIVTVSGTVTGIAIATPGFLTSPVASITAGQTNHVTLRERNGDVNRDGFRSQADYDAIVACYGSKVASCQYGYNADINDDGVVDGTDINLWLREA